MNLGGEVTQKQYKEIEKLLLKAMESIYASGLQDIKVIADSPRDAIERVCDGEGVEVGALSVGRPLLPQFWSVFDDSDNCVISPEWQELIDDDCDEEEEESA